MTNAAKAPPLSEWPEWAGSAFVEACFREEHSNLDGWITRTEREEYERQCREDSQRLNAFAEALWADGYEGIAIGLRDIAARIRESVK